MDYSDIYKQRVNRYGLNYQSRIQHEREKSFADYLLKTVYRVDFMYNKRLVPGSFERYKQDESETLHYLLTPVHCNMPSGTDLLIPNKDHILEHWMVVYLEDMKASGYNRYIMLKLNTRFTLDDGEEVWAYFHGPGEKAMRDTIKSRSGFTKGAGAIYLEDENDYFLILPRTTEIKKNLYLEIGEEPYRQPFRVMGYDIQSNPGVEYVTLEIVYEYDKNPPPDEVYDHIASTTDFEEGTGDFYWFNGGLDQGFEEEDR